MSYKPTHADLSGIEIPDSIKTLAEKLARNTHDIWAQTRIAEGWKYGPERNDEKKETPCMVAFEDLPEREKLIDYNTALSAIKFVLSMGYSIVKNESENDNK